MVNADLVEVPGAAPRIKSTFDVVSEKPLALDMTTIDQRDHSVLQTKAICRFTGNKLIYCVGAPGEPRPKTLATTTGDRNTLVVLRRSPEDTSSSGTLIMVNRSTRLTAEPLVHPR
jgi:hypothetical protein